MNKKQKKIILNVLFENKHGVATNIAMYVFCLFLMVMLASCYLAMGETTSIVDLVILANLAMFNLIIWWILISKADVLPGVAIILVAINTALVMGGISTSAFTNVSTLILGAFVGGRIAKRLKIW